MFDQISLQVDKIKMERRRKTVTTPQVETNRRQQHLPPLPETGGHDYRNPPVGLQGDSGVGVRT